MPVVFKHAAAALARGEAATLLVVVDHRGSAPGTTGARMVVASGGCAGTVGGGSVENQVVARGLTLGAPPALLDYDLTGGGEVDSICSGFQTVAAVRLGDGDRPTIATIVATLDAGGRGVMELSPAGLSFAAGEQAPRDFNAGEPNWSYRETLGLVDTLYLVGGGHVALALSRVVATLPFRIVVLDNRAELPTMDANRWASERVRVDYHRIADHIPDDPDHAWVAVMTNGHHADAQVVELLAAKPLRFLGLLGSRAKVAQVRTKLAAAGVPREQLDRVHAPVGLPIGSHTPEEVAISIAAQLVQLTNQSR